MRWRDIPWQASDRLVRQFAALWLVFFGGLAAWRAWVGSTGLAAALGAVAALGCLVGLARPAWLRPVFVAWMVLAFPIGWLVSNASMVLVYYGLITPLGLAFRLAGKDRLRLRPDPAAETYWQPRPLIEDGSRYLREF